MPEKEISNKQLAQSIADLAQVVKTGFDEQDKKMESGFAEQDKKMESRFIEQDKKTDEKIDALRTEMHDEFRRVHEEMDDIKIQLSNLEKRTLEDEGLLSQEFLNLKQKVNKLEKRLIELETAH